jgi:hypothetical protein
MKKECDDVNVLDNQYLRVSCLEKIFQFSFALNQQRITNIVVFYSDPFQKTIEIIVQTGNVSSEIVAMIPHGLTERLALSLWRYDVPGLLGRPVFLLSLIPES